MKNNLLVSLFLSILLTFNVFAAGSSDSGSSKTKTQYDMAVSHINAAKKLEQSDKLKKAKKRFEKAQKLLIQSNQKFPNKADTLNYLGFTTRKLGDYETAEKYYLQGLTLKPDHKGINEYLGELYVQTNRLDKAKERLDVLKNCNCEEYKELELIIKTRGSKVY